MEPRNVVVVDGKASADDQLRDLYARARAAPGRASDPALAAGHGQAGSV